MSDLKDKILGVIYGTAIGDALGWPVEFDQSVNPNNRKVHPQSVPEQYTDDTQMFRAVCEGLLRWSKPEDLLQEIIHGDKKALDAAAEEIAEEFIAWSKSKENNRAPGNACMEGCINLEKGISWSEAGAKSGGCGTAMRSMAYGIWFPGDPEEAADWAAQHALMTHRHPMAQAAAAAVAAGVASAMDPREGWTIRTVVSATMIRFASFWDADTCQMLQNVVACPRLAPYDALDKWRGWAGHEAVAASLWCFLKYPDDYEKAVLLAVNSPGDSDSLGAITGALVGARVGVKGIPERWVKQVEKSEELEVLGQRICKRLGVPW